MLQEKLNAITDHICNIHIFHDNKHYRQCGHDFLDENERMKAWLDPDSLVSTNKIGLLLCHSHFELRLRLRLS